MEEYFDFKEVRKKAIGGDEKAIAELQHWLEEHDKQFWDGESYYVGYGLRLYPIFKKSDYYDDEYELKGWELR